MVLPFYAAARERTEQFADVTVTPTTVTQEVLNGANQSIPADGFLRSVYIEVSASGGTAGSGALTADGPWNLIQSVTLTDVNGAPIFGPVSGYDLYLINKYGGYDFRGDPAAMPEYSAGVVTQMFGLRVPLEINRQTGFGSLGNQNASATYKLRITLNTIANMYSPAPTTPPNLRFRCFAETWTQPFPQDAVGRPQQTLPEGYGTTQYWSKQQFTLNGGAQNVQLARVGNLIRCLILVYRNTSNARIVNLTDMPDPIQFDWDARTAFIESLRYRRKCMVAMSPVNAAVTGAAQLDNGVLVYNLDRTILGHAGGGSTAYYYPTVQSTRMQFTCTWPVSGVLEVLTNDVAVYETNQAARFAEGSATGFHPQVGTPIPGAGA
jgi:hypothetical protein